MTLNYNGTADVFGIGSNHDVFELPNSRWGTNQWTGLGGWVSQIQAANFNNGQLEQVLGIGGDGGLYSNTEGYAGSTTFAGWVNLGKPFGTLVLNSPNVLSVNVSSFIVQPLGTSGLEVFATSPIGQLFDDIEKPVGYGYSFTGWNSIAPPSGDSVTGMASGLLADGDVALFTIDGTDGTVNALYQNPSSSRDLHQGYLPINETAKSLTAGPGGQWLAGPVS